MQRASVNSRLWSHRRKENITCCRWRAWYISPLAFTTNGTMSFETRKFYQRWNKLLFYVSYSKTSEWVKWKKWKISFSLLWTPVSWFLNKVLARRNITEQNIDIETINNLLSIGSLKTWKICIATFTSF